MGLSKGIIHVQVSLWTDETDPLSAFYPGFAGPVRRIMGVVYEDPISR